MPPSKTPTSGPPTRRLLGLTVALLTLLVLNLVHFDDLRVEPSLGVIETFTKPPHLASLLSGLLALGLLAVGHRHAIRVAAVVAWLQLGAFTALHLVPVEIGPTKPYWGPAMGDALQWVGLVLILGCCAAIVTAARRTAGPGAAPLPA